MARATACSARPRCIDGPVGDTGVEVFEVVARYFVAAMMARVVRAAITTATAFRTDLLYVLCCMLRFLMSLISDTVARTGYVRVWTNSIQAEHIDEEDTRNVSTMVA